MTNPPKNQRPVTLEDLLQLKRAERPSPEFWTRFESELRAKQLTAIMKRPWWRRFSTGAVFRHRLSLSAGALAAIAFVSFHEYRGSAAPSHPNLANADIAADSAVAPALERQSNEETLAVAVSNSGVAESLPQTLAAVEPSIRNEATSISVRAEISPEASSVMPWIMTAERLSSNGLSPTEKSIATNWEAAKVAHPELMDRLSGLSGFEKRNLPANHQAVDPLSQMRLPSELHLRRLMASARPAAAATVAPASDRFARHISEDRLTEEAIGRFDTRGNGVSLKF